MGHINLLGKVKQLLFADGRRFSKSLCIIHRDLRAIDGLVFFF